MLDLLLAGELAAAYDDRLLAEYRQVLARPRFSFDPPAVADLLDFLVAGGQPVVARPLPASLPDPEDLPFLEVAVAAVAVLITGNRRPFPAEARGGVQVLSPAEFIVEWQKASRENETNPGNDS